MRRAYHDITIVVANVVDTHGDGLSQCPARIVMVEHFAGVLPPAAARVLEVADQFLLLGVHADYRQPLPQIQLTHTSDVAELPVSIRVLKAGLLLAAGLQGEAKIAEQPTDRGQR